MQPQIVGDNQTGAYCPLCRDAGNPKAMAMRDNVDCFCLMGHRMPHARFWAMNPEMIKPTVRFGPGPGDIKVEVWCNQEVYMKAKEALGERFHPTIASLIRCCMAGEPVIIDGQQAAELRKLGVKNGAEILATVKLNSELSGQNEYLTEELNKWEKRFENALASTQ
jgi:hypothetical protein